MTLLAQDAVIAEGFVDIMSFAELRDKDIHKMVKTINAAPINLAAPVALIPQPVVQRGRGCGRGRQEPPVIPPVPIPLVPPPAMVKTTRRSARRLCGSVYLVKDKIRRGILINPYDFTENKELLSQANGRSDVLALRAHYGGSGNTTTMLAEAKMMYDTLVYRGETNKTKLID
jgi:hypothetical protein